MQNILNSQVCNSIENEQEREFRRMNFKNLCIKNKYAICHFRSFEIVFNAKLGKWFSFFIQQLYDCKHILFKYDTVGCQMKWFSIIHIMCVIFAIENLYNIVLFLLVSNDSIQYVALNLILLCEQYTFNGMEMEKKKKKKKKQYKMNMSRVATYMRY